MTSEQVTALIEDEIGDNWSRSNLHGVVLKTCLVPPQVQAYTDSFQPDQKLSLWLVLEENPATKSGYKIVFDEFTGRFGLATEDVFIGFYGSFLETLEGM